MSILALAWCTSGGSAQSVGPVGVVDRVSGPWVRVQDQRPLVRGMLLYEGDTVSPGRATDGGVEVLIFAGDRRWEQPCSEAEPCSGSYRPSGDAEAERGFWAFLSSYWEDGQQLPPVLAGARSATARGPSHALIALEDGVADLSPALAGIPDDDVAVRLVSAPGGSLRDAGAAGEVVVRAEAGDAVRVGGLQPGLYLVSVADGSGEALGAAALALVHPDRDGTLRNLWEEARQRTAAWADADPVTRAALLAQVLYALDGRPD